MANKKVQYDPQLREVHRILDKVRKTHVLRWKLSSLQMRLTKLKEIQERRGGGFFGIDITPEIAFLEAAIKIKQAG